MRATNPELYRPLFTAAIALRELEAWKFMSDFDQVTVRDPDTGELGRCVMMGSGGNTFGLAIYRGKSGSANLERTFEMAEEGYDPGNDLWSGFLYNSFGLFFVSSDEMEPEDKALCKALDIKFRGKNKYIQFRNMEPGFSADLHFTAEQIKFFTHCVEQTTDVARRLKGGPGAGPEPDMDHENFLVRHPVKTANGISWEDRYEVLPEVSIFDMLPPVDVDEKLLIGLREKLPRTEQGTAAYVMIPSPSFVMDKDRPYSPVICIMIDGKTGQVANPNILSYEELQTDFCEKFAAGFTKLGRLPEQIHVVDKVTQLTLKPLCDLLEIDIILDEDNEQLHDFSEFILFQTSLGAGG